MVSRDRCPHRPATFLDFWRKISPLLMQGGVGLCMGIILWLRRSSFWQTGNAGQRARRRRPDRSRPCRAQRSPAWRRCPWQRPHRRRNTPAPAPADRTAGCVISSSYSVAHSVAKVHRITLILIISCRSGEVNSHIA